MTGTFISKTAASRTMLFVKSYIDCIKSESSLIFLTRQAYLIHPFLPGFKLEQSLQTCFTISFQTRGFKGQ